MSWLVAFSQQEKGHLSIKACSHHDKAAGPRGREHRRARLHAEHSAMRFWGEKPEFGSALQRGHAGGLGEHMYSCLFPLQSSSQVLVEGGMGIISLPLPRLPVPGWE